MRKTYRTAATVAAAAFSLTAVYGSSDTFPAGFDNLGGKTEQLSVRSIAQDSCGTIWFGTDKCLYTYDGYDVTPHRNGIGNKQINAIAISGDTLFLGCNGGLLVYDRLNETYSEVSYFTSDQIQALNICEGVLYVGADSGLYSVLPDNEQSSKSIIRLSAGSVQSLAFRSGLLYAGGTTDELNVYDTEKGVMTSVPLKELMLTDRWNVVSALFCDNDSTAYAGTVTSLIRIDTGERKASRLMTIPVAKSICRYSDHILLVGTDNGLLSYDERTGKSETVWNGSVSANLTDRDGRLWLATNVGLLLSRKNKVMKEIDTSPLPGNASFTRMLADSRGRLWVGSVNGLALFQHDTSGTYRLQRRYSMNDGAFPIAHNNINSITEDRHNHTVYVGSDGGCLVYDEKSGQFTLNNLEGTYNWVYDVLIDGNDLWLASFEGLFRQRSGSTVDRYTTDEGLTSNDIAKIAKDRSGNIWILTRDQNVFTLDKEKKSVVRFPVGECASTEYADCLANDIEGTIWISAKNELLQVNGYNDVPVRKIVLGNRKGLTASAMTDIGKQMWVCTSDGIFIVNKDNGESGHINTGSGFVSICHDETAGNVILGAVGKISFLPVTEARSLSADEQFTLRITSVTVNGERAIPEKELASGSITLGHNENNLLVSFSDYNYNGEIPRRFRYSLVRKDRENWNDVVADNTFVLSDIKPGRYRLYISSLNTRDTAGCLDITVRRPWYGSIPMMLVYLAIICAIAWSLVHYMTLKRYLGLEREQRNVLQEQFREKEAFFGNIAHELKTPLSMVIAPLGKLAKEMEEGPQLQLIQIAHDNATKLNSLIHNTLNFYSDNTSNASDLIRSEVEFVELARTLFYSYKDSYPDDEFIFSSSDQTMIADIDVIKTEAILNNLMSNACKYTPAGGSIIMSLEKDNTGPNIIIRVSDTGIGIPKEELPFVFQRYFESSRSKGGNYDSTGIGMSVVRKNVESHGGSVRVESDENGTTFTTVLPCLVKAGGAKSASPEKTPRQASDNPLIVIVDDNAQVCNFLSTVLKDRYRCISSNNGKSGLKLCRDVMPDLIISDVMMPVMDGLEMCRQLREYSPLATVPIILLTAKGDRETEQKSIALNIDSFIPKPFEFETLVAKIDQLLANRKRMEQRIRLEMLSVPKEATELSYDEKFLVRVTGMIEEHIDNPELSVRVLCELGNFNENQLYRKLKQLTGLSTVEYIRSIRLKKAALLLQNGNFTVSEVMYSVGFSNASYFTRAFVSAYGRTPSDYLKSYRQTSTLRQM